jgi:two-component system OmpR family sensor kinase
MGRFPIRIRLTLAFAVAMAVVLAATGFFLYARLGSALDRSVDQGLRARATVVTALAQQADAGLRASVQGSNNGFAQVIGTQGTVVDWTPGLTRRSLLSAAQLSSAVQSQHFFAGTLGGEPVRLLAVPVSAQGHRMVVVVGASLQPRAAALADLRDQLVIGGPLALLLASLAAYFLAAAALRPVERMGERAATISAASPGRRLPVPQANDEIARLGSRLNDMLVRLEAALERERTLVSNASHELRTPLALMKTEIELALAEPASAPELVAALRSAGEETDRLSQLADDLLLLARVDSGTLPLRRSRVAVEELLDSIATRFRRRADDAQREIEVVVPEGSEVLADRRRLEQALANLVENALRYGAGTVRLEGVEHSGSLELHVIDHGGGFPADFVSRAFERFSRGSRDSAGTGLGLAIVAAIADAHGGSATTSNRPEGGADVALLLPTSRAFVERRTPTAAPGRTPSRPRPENSPSVR